jgi:hypothetical protein
MPSAPYYRDQANLFFRMALASGDVERAAQVQGRFYLNLAGQLPTRSRTLHALLDGFNDQQMRKA